MGDLIAHEQKKNKALVFCPMEFAHTEKDHVMAPLDAAIGGGLEKPDAAARTNRFSSGDDEVSGVRELYGTGHERGASVTT